MGLSIKALGIRLVTNPAVVQLAKNGGFDALFVDLEHSTLSVNDASQICTAALQIDITPFVRVPYQCGNGFVQRVLDSGAMGVVFPHIHNKGEPLVRCTKQNYSNGFWNGYRRCGGCSGNLEVFSAGISVDDRPVASFRSSIDSSQDNHRGNQRTCLHCAFDD